MKIIPTFQLGGSFDQFLSTYTPMWKPFLALQERPTKQAKTSSEEKGKLTEKDFFSMLKDIKGLPNEVNAVINNLMHTFTTALLNEYDDLNSLSNMYMSCLQLISLLSYSESEYKNAYNRAVANDALNSLAITESNHLMVRNNKTGNVEYMNHTLWNRVKNSGNYTAFTISTALDYRARSPQAIGDLLILQTASNGIGLNKIAETLKSILPNIGKTEETRELYYTKSGLLVLKGAEMLLSLVSGGPEAVYKIKEIKSGEGKELIQAALEYVYSMLPTKMKNRLSWESGDSLDIIKRLITSTVSTKQEINVDIDGVASKAAGITSSTTGDKTKFGQWSQIMRGEGGIDRPMTIIEGETTYGMGLIGKYYSAFPGVEEGATTLSNFLSQTGALHIILSMEGITFGGCSINSADMSRIMYDNSGGYIATLPAKEINGIKVINIDFLKEYSNIVKGIKNSGIEENSLEFLTKLGEKLKEKGYESLLDANGLPNPRYFGNFLVILGYASEEVDSINEYYKKTKKENGINTIVKTDADDNPQLRDLMEAIIGDNVISRHWFTPDNDIYKAAVYIPLSNNPNDAANADNVKITLNQSRENESAYLYWQKVLNQQDTSSKNDM